LHVQALLMTLRNFLDSLNGKKEIIHRMPSLMFDLIGIDNALSKLTSSQIPLKLSSYVYDWRYFTQSMLTDVAKEVITNSHSSYSKLTGENQALLDKQKDRTYLISFNQKAQLLQSTLLLSGFGFCWPMLNLFTFRSLNKWKPILSRTLPANIFFTFVCVEMPQLLRRIKKTTTNFSDKNSFRLTTFSVWLTGISSLIILNRIPFMRVPGFAYGAILLYYYFDPVPSSKNPVH
jgi:hypothetical protein